jgi:hypothetical protein
MCQASSDHGKSYNLRPGIPREKDIPQNPLQLVYWGLIVPCLETVVRYRGQGFGAAGTSKGEEAHHST